MLPYGRSVNVCCRWLRGRNAPVLVSRGPVPRRGLAGVRRRRVCRGARILASLTQLARQDIGGAGECRPRPRSCAVLLQKLLVAAFDASTARRRLDPGSADRRGKLWRRSNVVSGSRRQTCLQFLLCARSELLRAPVRQVRRSVALVRVPGRRRVARSLRYASHQNRAADDAIGGFRQRLRRPVLRVCPAVPGCALVVQLRDVGRLQGADGLGGRQDLVPGVDTGVVRYDGTAAQTCLDALKDCSVFGIDGKPAACLALFTGTIGDGGTCALDAACVSGLCDQSQGCGACATRSGGGGACTINRDCEVGLSCVAGLCDLRPEPPLGVSCLDSFECGPQAFCPTPVADPTTWHCQARGGAGDPCVWEGSCLTGLRCTGKAPKWVCAVSPGAGDACIDSFSDDDCAPNLACVTDQNGASTCQPRVGLGAPCSQSGMCQGQDLRCADGSCALLGGKGATCFGVAESGKLECFPGLDCVGHVCVDMPVAGQPCDFRCDNATCVENVCVALASEGQACGDGCLNGLVCDDATGAALCTVCH